MENGSSNHIAEDRAKGRKSKKKKAAKMLRKERRRSIDMKVPDLFDDEDEGIFGL